MKRLLEWKQRMLQSPLTRKSGNSVVSGGSGARSSERSTPTLADRDAPSPRMRIDSPLLHPQQQQQQQLHQQPSKLFFTSSALLRRGVDLFLFFFLSAWASYNSRTLHILFRLISFPFFLCVCLSGTHKGWRFLIVKFLL